MIYPRCYVIIVSCVQYEKHTDFGDIGVVEPIPNRGMGKKQVVMHDAPTNADFIPKRLKPDRIPESLRRKWKAGRRVLDDRFHYY